MSKRFGAYEILHELKSGGMGAVLLGRRRGPGAFEQLVALKTIRSELAAAPAVRAMFLDEAAILSRLAHPGIATVHDFGEENGTLYMAMEYVAGTSFRGLTDAGVPPVVAARAIAEACRGLHAAHEVRDTAGHVMGVVHRDISPDNLMLGYDGHVKVIDFGIALVKNRQAPVTELGTIKGKPPYMSPEQVKNEAIDRRSDVFSLAVVLHEMLTGQPLFGGSSIYATALAVEHQVILPPSQVIGRSLPAGLDTVVLAALDRDLARRTPTAAALAEQLEQVIQGAGGETLEAWTERALAGPREAHRRWLAGVVAGRDAPRPVVGRATGAVTQLPPEQAAALAAIAPPRYPEPDPHGKTSVAPPPGAASPEVPTPAGPTPPEPMPPRVARSELSAHLPTAVGNDAAPRPTPRRLGLALLLALIVLLAGGAAVWFLLLREPVGARSPDAAVIAIADAAIDSPAIVIAPAPDASAEAPEPPADAAVIIPPRDGPPADALRRARADAGAFTAPRDAAEPPADTAPATPAEPGRISIVGRGEAFLNILVDGQPFQVTPQLAKPIAAGRHTIVLLDPKTNKVVYETTVVIEPGKHVRVQPPP